MIPGIAPNKLAAALLRECAKWSPVMPLSAALTAILKRPEDVADTVLQDAAAAYLRVGGWLEVDDE
jgi:hypothetical protein